MSAVMALFPLPPSLPISPPPFFFAPDDNPRQTRPAPFSLAKTGTRTAIYMLLFDRLFRCPGQILSPPLYLFSNPLLLLRLFIF